MFLPNVSNTSHSNLQQGSHINDEKDRNTFKRLKNIAVGDIYWKHNMNDPSCEYGKYHIGKFCRLH